MVVFRPPTEVERNDQVNRSLRPKDGRIGGVERQARIDQVHFFPPDFHRLVDLHEFSACQLKNIRTRVDEQITRSCDLSSFKLRISRERYTKVAN